MLKCTKFLGTASALATAALLASPAAANSLTGLAGTLTTEYSHFKADSGSLINSDSNNWLLGGSAAMPLSDLMNLNFQADVSYRHSWESDFSAETWNFGGSGFWAGNDGRVGLNFNYLTLAGGRDPNLSPSVPRRSHLTNGGVFGEWYFDNITLMAKGGWTSSGGSGFGGNGNYAGGAVEFYVIPDLGITGGVEWSQTISGFGQQTFGRSGVNNTVWEVTAEWLVAEDYGVSIYGGYSHLGRKVGAFNIDDSDNILRVGLHWYVSGGSLIDHQRNGTLNPWLPAVNAGL